LTRLVRQTDRPPRRPEMTVTDVLVASSVAVTPGETVSSSETVSASETASSADGLVATRQRPAVAAAPRVPRSHARAPGGPPWPLLIILALQAALSLRLIWSNTAFADEALYLWAGHLELASWLHATPIPANIDPFATYFSGAPALYPPVGAIADAYGGLAGARLLSLAFMLGATSLLYATTLHLLRRPAAIAAAAVFAVLGPTQFLGAFATYDAMALFLLALAAWLAVRSRYRGGEALLVAAGLVLALADATKYATTLWDPAVLALAALTTVPGTWTRGVLRAARLAAYTAAPLAAALYGLGGEPYIRGILFTTLARKASGATASPALVLGDSLSWIWPVLALAALAVGVSFTDTPRIRMLCATCGAAALAAPLHQAQIHTVVALYKHCGFGSWFGAIAAGYVLARAVQLCHPKGWRVVAAVAAVIVFAGLVQVNELYVAGWPDTSAVTATLARVLPGESCPCLVMDDSVAEYYLIATLPTARYGQVTDAYFFSYWDPARQRMTTGTGAYLRAVHDHYFRLVEIDPAQSGQLDAAVGRALAGTPGYRRIAAYPIRNQGRGKIEIWQYEPGR
jgi:4-amino-4-deoxy-L-arabinose transferase-like glycosyltransferase